MWRFAMVTRFSFLAHEGVLARKLELAGNPHRLVSTVLEELDMSFGDHGHNEWFGLIVTRCGNGAPYTCEVHDPFWIANLRPWI